MQLAMTQLPNFFKDKYRGSGDASAAHCPVLLRGAQAWPSLGLEQPALGRHRGVGDGVTKDPGRTKGIEERRILAPRIAHRCPQGQDLQGHGGLGCRKAPGKHLWRQGPQPGSSTREGQKPRLAVMEPL